MTRKSILDVMRDILRFLSSGKEYSIKSISYEVGSRWETTLKALEFLEEIGVVSERPGESRYKAERLFKKIN